MAPEQRIVDRMRRWLPPVIIDVFRRVRYGRPAQQTSGGEESWTLSVRSIEELFPGISRATIAFPASRIRTYHHMVMPLPELLTLAAITRHLRPSCVFEFGTYTGSSTLLLAMNADDEAVIHTVDVEAEHPTTAGTAVEGRVPVGAEFRGTSFEPRIRQWLGDTRTFDINPFIAAIDLILVDADHSYEFVRADTESAFRMLRPGGVIIWDDYTWNPQFPECAGVTRAVNEIARTRRCYRVEGTRFAVYVDSTDGVFHR